MTATNPRLAAPQTGLQRSAALLSVERLLIYYLGMQQLSVLVLSATAASLCLVCTPAAPPEPAPSAVIAGASSDPATTESKAPAAPDEPGVEAVPASPPEAAGAEVVVEEFEYGDAMVLRVESGDDLDAKIVHAVLSRGNFRSRIARCLNPGQDGGMQPHRTNLEVGIDGEVRPVDAFSGCVGDVVTKLRFPARKSAASFAVIFASGGS